MRFSMAYWKSIQNHIWTPNKYNMAVKYLSGDKTEYLAMNEEARKAFRVRMAKGYKLHTDGEHLVLKTRFVPPYLRHTEVTEEDLEFFVVHPTDVENVIGSYFEDEKNVALNYKTLYDKIFRSRLLGISRSAVEDYMKKHPRQLVQLRNVGGKPFVKSYRPMYPFEHWQVDFINFNKLQLGERRTNQRYKHILVVIDIFSKFVYLYPTETESAEEACRVLQKIFLSGDIPKKIGCDNVPFNSEIFKEFCDMYGVKLINSFPHNPQTNGFVERKNSQVKCMLALHFNKYNVRTFYDVLDHVAFNINNTKHSVTGMTPMEIHRGRVLNVNPMQMNGGGDACDEVSEDEVTENDKVNLGEYAKVSKRVYDSRVLHIRQKLDKAARKTEERFEKRRDAFQVGDKVHIATYLRRDEQVQPVQIELRSSVDGIVVAPQNPLYMVKSNRKVYINDLRQYQAAMMPSMVLKAFSYKWRWGSSGLRDVFTIESIIRRDNSIGYTLRQDDYKVFRLKQVPNVYGDEFGKELLQHARESSERASAQTRPDYNETIDYDKPILNLSAAKQQPSVQASYVEDDDEEYLHKTALELFKKELNRLLAIKNKKTDTTSLIDVEIMHVDTDHNASPKRLVFYKGKIIDKYYIDYQGKYQHVFKVKYSYEGKHVSINFIKLDPTKYDTSQVRKVSDHWFFVDPKQVVSKLKNLRSAENSG